MFLAVQQGTYARHAIYHSVHLNDYALIEVCVHMIFHVKYIPHYTICVRF